MNSPRTGLGRGVVHGRVRRPLNVLISQYKKSHNFQFPILIFTFFRTFTFLLWFIVFVRFTLATASWLP